MIDKFQKLAILSFLPAVMLMISCDSKHSEEPVQAAPEPAITVSWETEPVSEAIEPEEKQEAVEPEEPESEPEAADAGISVTEGTEDYEGFVVDNIMHFPKGIDDLHFHMYVPQSYDGSEPYALYITLPGFGGYIQHGEYIGNNLREESYGINSRKYNDKMIVVAAQPEILEENYDNVMNEFPVHSDQVIGLTEYLLSNYNIDRNKVYISGYSRGGECMSLILTKRPDLYSAALSISSIWRGDENVITDNKLPIYFVIGREDEPYGSEPISETYEKIASTYEKEGISKDEMKNLVVLDIKDWDYFRSRGYDSQHLGADLFSTDDKVMNWLLNHNN